MRNLATALDILLHAHIEQLHHDSKNSHQLTDKATKMHLIALDKIVISLYSILMPHVIAGREDTLQDLLAESLRDRLEDAISFVKENMEKALAVSEVPNG